MRLRSAQAEPEMGRVNLYPVLDSLWSISIYIADAVNYTMRR